MENQEERGPWKEYGSCKEDDDPYVIKIVKMERLLSNSCKQTSTLSNTAEIVENESRFKLSPLQLNDFVCNNSFKE